MPTESSNVLPIADGLDLGSPSQRWDGYFRNLTVTGNLTASGSTTHAFPMLNVLDYGADNNAGFYPSCSTGNGSKNITVSVANRWGSMPTVGMSILVARAGAAGADLSSKITAINGNTITLQDACSASLNPVGVAWGSDSTTAIQAAITAAVGFGGGAIYFPAGLYLCSTVTVPANVGVNSGRISLIGAGREATRIVGTGADQTAIVSLVGPAGSSGAHATTVQGIGFDSFDYNSRRSTGVYVGGGISHEVRDCKFANCYNGIRASGTWLSRWDFNYFYGLSDSGIKYDSSSGVAVISCWATYNEFGLVGKWCVENTSSGGGGSNTNRYLFNDFEGTIPTGALYIKGETWPVVIGNRLEPDNIGGNTAWRALYLDTVQGGTFIGNNFSAVSPATYGVEFINNCAGNVFQANVFGTGGSSGTVYVPAGVGVNYWYQTQKTLFGGANIFQQQFFHSVEGVVHCNSMQMFERGDEPGNGRAKPGLCNNGIFQWASTTSPSTGTWVRGDIVWDSLPTETGTAGSKYTRLGWRCTLGGTPGTWVEMRTLTGN